MAHSDPHYYDAAIWLGLRNQRHTNELLRQQISATRYVFLADDPQTRRAINIRGDHGGQPGEWIRADLDARWYHWDNRQAAYVHTGATPPPPAPPTLLGSLAWTCWWAWAPALFAGFIGALAMQPDPEKPISNAAVFFISMIVFCGIWMLVHGLRILAFNARSSAN